MYLCTSRTRYYFYNTKYRKIENFENSGLPGFVYLSAFLLRNKKIHSETLLCFHSAHQKSLNRRRSHSSRPISWDVLNIIFWIFRSNSVGPSVLIILIYQISMPSRAPSSHWDFSMSILKLNVMGAPEMSSIFGIVHIPYMGITKK